MSSAIALQVAAPPASVGRETKRPRIIEPEVVEAVVLKDTTADIVPEIEVVQVENAAVAQHVENVAQPREAQPVVQDTEGEVFVGSIDQGTTSSRFIIFNRQGEPVEGHQIEFENLYPESGWHEHDPLELLSSVEECIEQTMRKFSASRPGASVRAVGITNQRETTVVWDSVTGEPLYNAVVWPDTRTGGLVRELRAREGSADLLQLCGLPLSTYPSSVKLLWLLRNVEAVSRAYEEGRLAFGTVDSWLIYRLNGGAKPPGGRGPVHVTDGTNASRTMFMNLRDMSYDDKLLGFFGIDPAKVQLPRIVPSVHPTSFGQMASGPLAGVRIAGCLGDQSSAVVGQCAFEAGQAKNTYGTGCFLLYNVGPEPVISKSGLLATVAFDFGPELGGRAYALEGSIAVAGSGVKFLQGNLGFAKESAEITALAEGVKDNGGVVFVTAFSGLFAPYWIDDAKGTLCESWAYGSFSVMLVPSDLPRADMFLYNAKLASHNTHKRGTSPGRPSRRHASRPRPSWTRWSAIAGTGSGRWRWTADCPTRTCACRRRRTSVGYRSTGRRCGRRRRWGRPSRPGSRLGCGRGSGTSPRSGARTGGCSSLARPRATARASNACSPSGSRPSR
ncbi:hypothetical protein RB601_009245 [Gaeumannomyces tritici]